VGVYQAQQVFFGYRVCGFFDLACQVEIVPADDAVFDQAVAGLCDLLFFLFGLRELAGIADGNRAREGVESGRGQDRIISFSASLF